MRVYPLIYSRTKFFDYVPGFLVRPSDINYEIAKKYTGQALNDDIKSVGGIRHAVFSVGEYYIYGGTACVTEDLIKKILAERKIDKLDYDYEDYRFDQANRSIEFFIGFCVSKNDISERKIPKIDLYETYKCYLEFLEHQWLEKGLPKTELDQSIEIDVAEYTESFVPQELNFNNKVFLRNYDEDNYAEIMNYYFYKMVTDRKKDYSFLSNVLSDNVSDCLYANISLFDVSPDSFVQNYKPVKNQNKVISQSESVSAPVTEPDDMLSRVKRRSDNYQESGIENERNSASSASGVKRLNKEYDDESFQKKNRFFSERRNSDFNNNRRNYSSSNRFGNSRQEEPQGNSTNETYNYPSNVDGQNSWISNNGVKHRAHVENKSVNSSCFNYENYNYINQRNVAAFAENKFRDSITAPKHQSSYYITSEQFEKLKKLTLLLELESLSYEDKKKLAELSSLSILGDIAGLESLKELSKLSQL